MKDGHESENSTTYTHLILLAWHFIIDVKLLYTYYNTLSERQICVSSP